jgi:hypothetical protein
MGEFLDTLKFVGSALRNKQDVTRLNDEADRIVKQMTGLPPRAFTREYRDTIFQQVKYNFLENFGPVYTAKEVAAFKLLCYSRQPLPHPFDKRVESALRTMAREISPSAFRMELAELGSHA